MMKPLSTPDDRAAAIEPADERMSEVLLEINELSCNLAINVVGVMSTLFGAEPTSNTDAPRPHGCAIDVLYDVRRYLWEALRTVGEIKSKL